MAEYGSRLIDLGKNILGDVLGILAVVKQAAACLQDQSPIEIDEHLESQMVLRGDSSDQFFFVRHKPRREMYVQLDNSSTKKTLLLIDTPGRRNLLFYYLGD